MKTQTFTITKRIAKHGKQSVIVIPSILSAHVKPSMLVKIQIDILEEGHPEGFVEELK